MDGSVVRVDHEIRYSWACDVITVIVGFPGAGKTLFTIAEVDKNFSGKRPIFYHGIEGLKLDGWNEFDCVEDWHRLPDGAIIVIDEAQAPGRFPARGNSKTKPDHIAAFETHRHRGHDVFLITQDAMLIDHVPRRLAEQMIQYYRPTPKIDFVVRRQFPKVLDPSWKANRRLSSTTWHRLPKKYFDAYLSSAVHTHIKRGGWKAFAIIPLIIVGYLVYGVLSDPGALLGVGSLSMAKGAADQKGSSDKAAGASGGRVGWVTALIESTRGSQAIVEYSDGTWETLPASVCGRIGTTITCTVRGQRVPFGRPLRPEIVEYRNSLDGRMGARGPES